jgi:hypothetical protein
LHDRGEPTRKSPDAVEQVGVVELPLHLDQDGVRDAVPFHLEEQGVDRFVPTRRNVAVAVDDDHSFVPSLAFAQALRRPGAILGRVW